MVNEEADPQVASFPEATASEFETYPSNLEETVEHKLGQESEAASDTHEI